MDDEEAAETAETSESYWRVHYDELADRDSHTLFSSESRDYFDRLQRAFPLNGDERALDFGCGLGFITAMLADHVRKLNFWDYSSGMLARTTESMSACEHAAPINLSEPDRDPRRAYDLIVVNSVVQYMSVYQLAEWLSRWRRMLDDDGAVLVSDLILPRSAFFKEVRDSLRFAAREGFLLSMLWHDAGQILRYLVTRNQAPMTRYSKRDFSEIAKRAGFEVEILPINLTYRSSRFSALLKRTTH